MSSQILTPDTPRGIRIVLVVNRKGGVGKSTFIKALASAAADRGEAVTIFDTDTSQSNLKWMQRARATSLWSETVKVAVSGDVDAIAARIGEISELPDQEHLILIDTYGGASPAYEHLIALADMALIPLPAAEDDFQETRETFEWTQRVAATKRTPALAAHINRALAEATDVLHMPEVQNG